ncbi:protein SMALL AUXIN UP-REGULATED RNA 12-like [Bidens hawaiensis]|uniref:protein SMALL AUXIN UP-REGULATED RNA 12-like n=1 Tax=Bidens hawaiensis TaxID=980011 RepID=UPI004049DD1B
MNNNIRIPNPFSPPPLSPMASSPVKNKISQIVRLKHVMQRWRRRCIPSAGGSLAIYVGSERRRFIIPTRFLNLPVFVSLLNKAEEEFGFQTTGGLTIPCDVGFFKKLLKVLDRNDTGLSSTLDLDDFAAMFAELAIDSSAHCKEVKFSRCRSYTPLLQKARV